MKEPTVGQALAQGRDRLTRALGSDGDFDAALLLEKATGLNRTGLILEKNRRLTETEATVFSDLLTRRLAGEPTQYLLGEWEFMGLPFRVDGRALIPRPDTELLVERALVGAPRLAADLGTGSGCIAISLAHYGGARVQAVDKSPAALELAWENAVLNGVAGQIDFWEGDLFAPLPPAFLGQLDVVASNPPYITGPEMEGLMREVREHEPSMALYGGPDGLRFYRRIVPESRRWLRPGGRLCVEIGCAQGAAVQKMMEDCGFSDVRVLQALDGLDRVVEGVYHV